MEWRDCRSCESKSHLGEAYELDPSPLIKRWIADIDIGQGDMRRRDDECTKHVSWYTDQGFTFLSLDEERGLQTISREAFKEAYDFEQYLSLGKWEMCVTVVMYFCEESGKARFDYEHCSLRGS